MASLCLVQSILHNCVKCGGVHFIASEEIRNCRLSQSILCDCSEIDVELEELRGEIEVVTELAKKEICKNARIAASQDEWIERNNCYLSGTARPPSGSPNLAIIEIN